MKRINLLINKEVHDKLDEMKAANKELPIRITKALLVNIAINRLYKDLENSNMEAIIFDYVANNTITASNEIPTIRNSERISFISNDGGVSNE